MLTGDHIRAAIAAVPQAAGRQFTTPDEIARLFNEAAARVPGAFASEVRWRALLSSCFMESWYYRATEEIDWSRPTAPQLTYPKPAGYDWGKLKARPYFRFIGRTLTQITWESNYLAFGKWLVTLGTLTNADTFVKDPEFLADPAWAALGAVWYVTQVKIAGRTSLEWVDADPDPCFAIACCVNLGMSPVMARARGKTPADMNQRRVAWDAWGTAGPIVASPAPAPAPAAQRWAVVSTRCHLRAGPSVRRVSLRRLMTGTRVLVLQTDSSRWARVQVDTATGWVNRTYLKDGIS